MKLARLLISIYPNLKLPTRKMSNEKLLISELRNKPFIVICGCTGTGKTKLSIQLAQLLINKGKKSEIINADAMQVRPNCTNPLYPI